VSYLYDKGRNRFLTGDLDWIDHTIRTQLLDQTDYTPNQSTHEFLSDVPGGARVGTAVDLAGKSAVAGVADANDATWTLVTGDQAEYILLYRFVTADADSPLIALIDSATGLPVTPNGGDIVVRWSELSNKIFKL
jgi:hypothetical protein